MQNAPHHKRLLSLDAFRGFTIAAMIIVNTPGSWDEVFSPLLHADWHGVTPTDYIFPFFIFIVGVSITLSYGKVRATDLPKRPVIWKTVKRATLIFCVGLFLWLFPAFDFTELRIPGVLQRIAIVFLVCALLFLYTSWKQQAVVGGAILLLYWAVLSWMPVPGVGAGVLEPGKNVAAWVDSLLIPGKMWQGTWDPEGILSTFPAVVTGIAGMLMGRMLTTERYTEEQRMVRLYLTGCLMFAIGAAWGWIFPLNKNLWTSSFVLYTAGLATLTLASCYVIIELMGYVKWAKPGLVFGSNAITAYVLGSMLPGALSAWVPQLNHWYVHAFIAGGACPKTASLVWSLGICLLCSLPAYVLYRKGIFIKI